MEKKKSSFGKSILISIAILILEIANLLVFHALKLPSWPFLVLLVVCAEVYGLSTDKFWSTVLSGLLGLVMGYFQVLLGLTGLSTAIVTIVFFVALVLLIALDVEKNVIVAHVLCLLNLNIVLNVPGLAERENLLPVFAAYALGTAIMAIILYAMRAVSKKSAEKKQTPKADTASGAE